MMDCDSAFVNFLIDSGKPKYLHENSLISQGRVAAITRSSSPWHRTVELLATFVCSSNASPNNCKMAMVVGKSSNVG